METDVVITGPDLISLTQLLWHPQIEEDWLPTEPRTSQWETDYLQTRISSVVKFVIWFAKLEFCSKNMRHWFRKHMHTIFHGRRKTINWGRWVTKWDGKTRFRLNSRESRRDIDLGILQTYMFPWTATNSKLTLPMLRLLLPKAQGCKYLW